MALQRIKWDREEDKAVVEFILDEIRSGNELATKPKGYDLWKLAQKHEITPHSASSMQTRWRKVIVPGLKSNNKEICEALSPVDVLYLQNRFCKSESKRARQRKTVEKGQVKSSSDKEELEKKESEGTSSRKWKRTRPFTPPLSEGGDVVNLEKTPVKNKRKERNKKAEKEEKRKEKSNSKQKKGNPSKNILVDVFYEPDQGENLSLEEIVDDIPGDISREDLEMEVGEFSESELEANYIPLDIPPRFSKRFKANMVRQAGTLESGDLQLVRRQYRVVEELALQYRTPYRIVLELVREMKNFQKVGQRLLERRMSILGYRSRIIHQLLADLPDCQI